MEYPREDEKGLDRPGAHRRQKIRTVEYEEHALVSLDSLFNSSERPILARRTISKYRRTVGNFLAISSRLVLKREVIYFGEGVFIPAISLLTFFAVELSSPPTHIDNVNEI